MLPQSFRRWAILLALGAALSTLTEAPLLQGQSIPSERALVLQGGAWLLDFDATVVSARAELPLGTSGHWLLVPGLTFAHGSLSSPPDADAILPEAQLHYQLTGGRFRPYVGAGAGVSMGNAVDRTFAEALTFAAGLRTELGSGWGLRLDTDVRWLGGYNSSTFGWSLGLAHRW